MEINAKVTVSHPATGNRTRAANTPADDGPFSQILKNAVKPAHTTPIVPAPATLTQLINSRSMFFMQNMPIEQRRSAVEDETFRPQAAALEPQKGAANRLLTQNAVSRG
jgi:hypothetical protein